jgi:hypothetical protein
VLAPFLHGVETLVHGGVDPAEEEAGHRGHRRQWDVPAVPVFHGRDVSFHHVLVGLEREEKGDVDVDSLGETFLDRGETLGRPRNLDEDVGPVDGQPQTPGLVDRVLRIPGQMGIDLQTHEPVGTVGPVIDWTEGVAGVLDVVDGHGLEDLGCGLTRFAQLPDLVVVIVPLGHCLVEDGGVRGHPGNPVFIDQFLKCSIANHSPSDVVQPDALTVLDHLEQGVVCHP